MAAFLAQLGDALKKTFGSQRRYGSHHPTFLNVCL